jgi:hypothetical protein
VSVDETQLASQVISETTTFSNVQSKRFPTYTWQQSSEKRGTRHPRTSTSRHPPFSMLVIAASPVVAVAAESSPRAARPSARRSARPASSTAKPVVSERTAFARRLQRADSKCAPRRRDVRAYAENDGRGPNPNDVGGVEFGGEMVGVGIFLLIAFQFFVLAFVDFPFQAR